MEGTTSACLDRSQKVMVTGVCDGAFFVRQKLSFRSPGRHNPAGAFPSRVHRCRCYRDYGVGRQLCAFTLGRLSGLYLVQENASRTFSF